jgi:hypothetical protein
MHPIPIQSDADVIGDMLDPLGQIGLPAGQAYLEYEPRKHSSGSYVTYSSMGPVQLQHVANA